MAAITSLLVCGLGAVGREVTLLVSFVVAMVLGVNPPFLNGLAVFAHKHALAQAHACRGDKCKGRGITHPSNGAKWSGKDERSGGLHKRSAEDCGKPLARARDGVSERT